MPVPGILKVFGRSCRAYFLEIADLLEYGIGEFHCSELTLGPCSVLHLRGGVSLAPYELRTPQNKTDRRTPCEYCLSSMVMVFILAFLCITYQSYVEIIHIFR